MANPEPADRSQPARPDIIRHHPVVLEEQAKADHDFTEQEVELKTNTQLTREIDRLTIELHNRLLGKSPRPGS